MPRSSSPALTAGQRFLQRATQAADAALAAVGSIACLSAERNERTLKAIEVECIEMGRDHRLRPDVVQLIITLADKVVHTAAVVEAAHELREDIRNLGVGSAIALSRTRLSPTSTTGTTPGIPRARSFVFEESTHVLRDMSHDDVSRSALGESTEGLTDDMSEEDEEG